MSDDYRGRGYKDRWDRLGILSIGESVKVVPLVVGYAAKKKFYDKLVTEKKEGVVFKRLDAKHKPGKAHSDMVKHKFYAAVSAVVLKHNQKNSIEVGLLDDSGTMVSMGNVTTIGHERPPVNSVCEIKYLYAYKGGCLYQPAYLGPRDDTDIEDCTTKQLKYKAED
jgi:bifunctional non-homologous end joining protein LigD